MDTYLAIASKRDERRYEARRVPADVLQRMLDAGRLSGSSRNRQPWVFVVSDERDRLESLAEHVYAPDNVRRAAIAVTIATPGGKAAFDVGRSVQNMMLAAWNDGVASCPNGIPDARATADFLGLEGDLTPVTVVSFGYPARRRDPTSRSAEEWSRRARRKPLEAVVRRA
ncbi:MAG: nitroreductase family protein [Actinomycetota bacterium]|nr:nitroreductase family protein [Actinomycetota bacterium]